MAKAKYKLGTFVKVAETSDVPAHFGAVEEVRMTATGTAYKVIGLEEAVQENEIATAYREVQPRKASSKTPKAPRTSKKKEKNEARAPQA